MSRGNDGRGSREGDSKGRGERGARTSRTSVRMTVERARAIQARADRSGTNLDFKARAMSAAARNDEEGGDDGDA